MANEFAMYTAASARQVVEIVPLLARPQWKSKVILQEQAFEFVSGSFS
jgi:hypothetical protein